METSSMHLCNRCSPWQGLLLTASLVICWHLSTAAPATIESVPVTIESVPPHVVEGENVLFLAYNLPDNVQSLFWAKGVTTMNLGIATYILSENLSIPGTVNSGRETVYPNGSLLIRNVTKKDTGFYTLRTLTKPFSILSTTSIYLHVHTVFWTCGRHDTSTQLTVETVPPCAAEGASVFLRIHNPPENIVGYVWFKWMTALQKLEIARYTVDRKSTVWGPAYSGRETVYQDGSLLIHGVTQQDSGLYTLQIVRTDMIREEAQAQLQLGTSLSPYCKPLSSSQLVVQPVPRYAAEGAGVLLKVHNLPEDMQVFTWYKSKKRIPVLKVAEYRRDTNAITWGSVHRTDDMVYNNGSLLLPDLTEKDGGIYTLAVLKKDSTIEKAYVKFYVKTCLLTSWHLSTIAHVTTESVPRLVAEGDNVIFLVRDLPENIVSLAWFKGLRNTKQAIAIYALDKNLSLPGPAHSGQETIYHNGSLLLKNVNHKDAGFYTLQTYNKSGKVVSTTSMYLHVQDFLWKCGRLGSSAKPTIESVPPSVAVGGSVLLLVHNPPENVLGFLWFKGRVEFKNIVAARFILHGRSTVWGPAYSGRETLHSDGSLLIHSVSQKDPELYTLRILRTDMGSDNARVLLQMDTSLSPYCNPLSSSKLMIHPVPRYAAEGEGVLLQVQNLPEGLQAFSWYKSEYRTPVLKIVEYRRDMNSISWEPAHRKRGMVYRNGSLILHDVTEKDAGIYRLSVINKDFNVEKAYVELYVKTSFLTSWHLLTTAQVITEAVPPLVAEGDDVLFLVHDLPKKIKALTWFKGLTNTTQDIATYDLHNNFSQPGSMHSGRETIYHNGSLLLEKANLKDTGFYTLRTYNRLGKILTTAFLYLRVHTSLSPYCKPLTSSQLMVHPVPRYAAEGESVLLQVHNLPEDLQALFWYKSEHRTPDHKIVEYARIVNSVFWGPAYRKGMVYTNGSLMLQNVTKKDASIYTLAMLNQNFNFEKADVEFHVQKYVTQPFVQVTDNTVTGGTSVIFTCISPDTDTSIRWIFNKKNLHLRKRMTLSPTKCGLKIDPVRNADAGEYQCEVSNRLSSKTSLPVSWP
ncbi:Gm5155 [Phodopus roborovskii]|uniref:Gm5155 protein n=1 Tax=Phodopus roborovskii TaxID=109678 RepID=A0AAV0AC64_PHORO|nr:Gm5155 [Phodopus roborovskii]